MDPMPLTTIFDECFSRVRVLRIQKDKVDKFQDLLPTEKKRKLQLAGAPVKDSYDRFFQDFEGADMENYEYFTFRYTK